MEKRWTIHSIDTGNSSVIVKVQMDKDHVCANLLDQNRCDAEWESLPLELPLEDDEVEYTQMFPEGSRLIRITLGQFCRWRQSVDPPRFNLAPCLADWERFKKDQAYK